MIPAMEGSTTSPRATTTTMASGLLEWSNAIRFTMANDPGREIFKDQLNDHGFLFLEDYLANILRGAKQDTMIELLKTPGRKKALNANAKTASKLKYVVSSFPNATMADLFSVDEILIATENQAVQYIDTPGSSSQTQQITPSKSERENSALLNIASEPPVTVHPLQSAGPDISYQKDLSVIAEDDENGDTQPQDTRTNSLHHNVGESQESTEYFSQSESTPPSISPPAPPDAAFDSHAPQSSFLLGATSPPLIDLPKIPLGPQNGAISTNAPPKESFHDQIQASVLVESTESKSGTMLYPALPAPLPLRKSMRTPRDPSVNSAPPTTATPGSELGGKRTSWLRKVREVKALDSTSRSHAPTFANVPYSQSLKRKSEDLEPQTVTGQDEEERQSKTAKNVEGDVTESLPKALHFATVDHDLLDSRIQTDLDVQIEQEGMLDRLKKTVEGLGVRVGKSIGKSLGVGAIALAEAARAAAEVRVAERDANMESLKAVESNFAMPVPIPTEGVVPLTLEKEANDRSQHRLSVSDLFPPPDGSIKMKSRAGASSSLFVPKSMTIALQDKGDMKTTPPSSPRPVETYRPALQVEPVFIKPPPVFIRPKSPSSTSLKLAQSQPPVHETEDPLFQASYLTGTTQAPNTDAETISRVPYSRDIESSRFQPQDTQPFDDTDTWSTCEKQNIGTHWDFAAMAKEDDFTSSTLPSQQGDTGLVIDAPLGAMERPMEIVPVPFAVEMANEDLLIGPQASGLSELNITMSESQASLTSSQSQNPGLGIKFGSNTLGASKKGKPEVKKVLQMAAVAAKKQHEESEKKAARLRDMEQRRQLALQRKVDDEKAKALDQEKKVKEENERRKRDREETTDKRPLRSVTSGKKEEEVAKKRKVVISEADKKDLKRAPSKSALKPVLKTPMALSSSTVFNTSMASGGVVSNAPETKSLKNMVDSEKGKSKMPSSSLKRNPGVEDDISKPSQLIHMQMAARAKAQLQAARQEPETIPSESIELPDINSEYSDSEDEDRPRTFDPPGWAQSPELREALQFQSTINPDDVFGTIQPLKMEELFKTRTSKFRARTSSANWTGADRLTLQEEKDYARRMGFK